MDLFGLINMNGRIYDPALGRFLSPDPYVQMPDNSQNFNRYSYALNNPLVYTDPSGEFPWLIVGIGALVGGYLGGSAAEGWQMNPGKWDWDAETWAGIGIGAAIGGAAGFGASLAGPALANTSFFANFGTTGMVGAYTVTGAFAGGVTGYGAGFAGGMLHSNSNWGYAHQSGIFGTKLGATAGSVIGAAFGLASQEGREMFSDVFSDAPTYSMEVSVEPKWNGLYFQGSQDEARKLLLESSMLFNKETSYWYTSKGYYFPPLSGDAYGYKYVYKYDPYRIEPVKLNVFLGYRTNTIKGTFRYTPVEKNVGDLYLYPDIFNRNRSRAYYKAHTHPRNNEPGGSDLLISRLLGIPGIVFTWDGRMFKYGW